LHACSSGDRAGAS